MVVIFMFAYFVLLLLILYADAIYQRVTFGTTITHSVVIVVFNTALYWSLRLSLLWRILWLGLLWLAYLANWFIGVGA